MKAFTTQMQVRFGHVDPAGIAYFPRIFDYIHEAFEEVWEEHVGVRYDHLVVERRLGFPLVHSEARFTKSLHFGDRPIVRVTCFRLGRSSLGLRYRYSTDDELCVDARMITVCTRLDVMQSTPIPGEFRAKFEQIREDA